MNLCKTCNHPTVFKCGYCLRCMTAAATEDRKALDRLKSDIDACNLPSPLLDDEQDAMDAAAIAREQDAQVRRTHAATVRRLRETGGVM